MDQVTAEQVEKAVGEAGRTRWRLRECSICGEGLHYLFDGPHVGYQSACGCTRYWSPPELRSWSEVASTLNMQNPEVRSRMWTELTTPEEAA